MIVRTRPNGDNGSAGWTIGGGSISRAAALNDSSDSTYVTGTANGLNLGLTFDEPTVPAGALAAFAVLIVRNTLLSTPVGVQPKLNGVLTTEGKATLFSQNVNWLVATDVGLTIHIPPAGTELDVDDPQAIWQAVAFGQRIYEAYIDWYLVNKPVLDVTAPTGTLTTNNRPVVAWTNTLDPVGGSQARRQIKIFTAAQYGIGGFNPESSPSTLDSGVLGSSATDWQAPTAIADGTYRAYVKVAQIVNGITHWSDWTYEPFVVDVDRPAVPTFTLANQDALGMIEIQLQEVAGAADTDWWELQSTPENDTVWTDVRTELGGGKVINPNPGALGSAFVSDYEPANSKVTYYRARAVTDHGGGLTVSSSWSTLGPFEVWSSSKWWVKHPIFTELNLECITWSQQGHERSSRNGIFQGLGNADVIVVTDKAAPKQGSIAFMLEREVDRQKVDYIIAAGTPVLIQSPFGAHWQDRWVSLLSHDRKPIVDKDAALTSIDSFEWIEVPRPD